MGDKNSIPSVIAGGAELLDRVGPLWLQLRQHHADTTPQWAAQLLARPFDERRAELIAKSPRGMLVLLVSDSTRDVGYCVSGISADGHGEIDSIFVVASHRRAGIGDALMLRALEWFAGQSVQQISLDVMVGNKAAVAFYARHGFQPRTIRLRRPPNPTHSNS